MSVNGNCVARVNGGLGFGAVLVNLDCLVLCVNVVCGEDYGCAGLNYCLSAAEREGAVKYLNDFVCGSEGFLCGVFLAEIVEECLRCCAVLEQLLVESLFLSENGKSLSFGNVESFKKVLCKAVFNYSRVNTA